MAETLAEVKRLCRLIASTEINYKEYNNKLKEISVVHLEYVVKWEGCDILSNGDYFVIVYHYKNVLEIYKPIQK